MKDLYKAPEAKILEVEVSTDVCAPSQATFTNVPADFKDVDGDEI